MYVFREKIIKVADTQANNMTIHYTICSKNPSEKQDQSYIAISHPPCHIVQAKAKQSSSLRPQQQLCMSNSPVLYSPDTDRAMGRRLMKSRLNNVQEMFGFWRMKLAVQEPSKVSSRYFTNTKVPPRESTKNQFAFFSNWFLP